MSDNKKAIKLNSQLKRLLKLLAKSYATKFSVANDAKNFTIFIAERNYSFKASTLDKACRESLIVRNEDTLRLSKDGQSYLKRMLNPDMPFIAQHADLTKTTIKINNAHQQVLKNDNESALTRLYQRKDRNGVGWIDHNEFQAGERLRSDFEKAQLSPKISAHWNASVTAKNCAGGGRNEISDFAFDAKRRLEKSIAALGPELSGVALDVCCFLKGLENVEREKGWPPRSAKLLLKTALSVLVRHYGITSHLQVRSNRFWGANNYRPEILF